MKQFTCVRISPNMYRMVSLYSECFALALFCLKVHNTIFKTNKDYFVENRCIEESGLLVYK